MELLAKAPTARCRDADEVCDRVDEVLGLAGGFARYYGVRYWLIPHIEKNLYDNAQVLRTYPRSHRSPA